MSQQSPITHPSQHSVQASDLVIWHYCPNVDGKHIGFAYHKYFLLGFASSLVFLFVVALLVGISAPPLPYLFVMGFFYLFLLILVRKSYLKKIVPFGIYEVDIQGRAIRLLATTPDEEREKGLTALQLGFPMGRRRFLRTVQQ
jgi:hypothetical protein